MRMAIHVDEFKHKLERVDEDLRIFEKPGGWLLQEFGDCEQCFHSDHLILITITNSVCLYLQCTLHCHASHPRPRYHGHSKSSSISSP